jgi:hypothetical protein
LYRFDLVNFFIITDVESGQESRWLMQICWGYVFAKCAVKFFITSSILYNCLEFMEGRVHESKYSRGFYPNLKTPESTLLLAVILFDVILLFSQHVISTGSIDCSMFSRRDLCNKCVDVTRRVKWHRETSGPRVHCGPAWVLWGGRIRECGVRTIGRNGALSAAGCAGRLMRFQRYRSSPSLSSYRDHIPGVALCNSVARDRLGSSAPSNSGRVKGVWATPQRLSGLTL